MVDGHEVIASLVERPERSGLIMDFDGVLAPIVADPGESRLLPGTAELIADLASGFALVALVSGRPVAFLAERAAVPGVALLGAYGVETQRDGRRHVLPEGERFRPTVAQATADLHRQFDGSPGTEGIRVEDKGLAVAVHWRQAQDEPAARRLVQDAIGELIARTGLHREPGKLVEELRPPVEQDKGTAVRRLIEEAKLERIAYAGDDLGDVPALQAVAEVGGYALVVAHGAETSPEVTAAAKVVFDGVEGFVAWLRELRDTLVTARR
jgi:trehalose 6-phosphate phosphatase